MDSCCKNIDFLVTPKAVTPVTLGDTEHVVRRCHQTLIYTVGI